VGVKWALRRNGSVEFCVIPEERNFVNSTLIFDLSSDEAKYEWARIDFQNEESMFATSCENEKRCEGVRRCSSEAKRRKVARSETHLVEVVAVIAILIITLVCIIIGEHYWQRGEEGEGRRLQQIYFAVV